jgi:hypothetical protein
VGDRELCGLNCEAAYRDSNHQCSYLLKEDWRTENSCEDYSIAARALAM